MVPRSRLDVEYRFVRERKQSSIRSKGSTGRREGARRSGGCTPWGVRLTLKSYCDKRRPVICSGGANRGRLLVRPGTDLLYSLNFVCAASFHLLLILAAAASKGDRLPGRTSSFSAAFTCFRTKLLRLVQAKASSLRLPKALQEALLGLRRVAE